jgi:3-hydroxyacyl-CoA dehydrogenase
MKVIVIDLHAKALEAGMSALAGSLERRVSKGKPGMRLGANRPIGPLALADLIGLDVCLSVLDVLFNDFRDSIYRASPLLREYVAAGQLGRKTRRGVYRYD